VEYARTVVLRRLSVSARTRRELAEDLGLRGVPSEAIEQVLDRFTEVGLIDDAEFARLWVESRRRSRGSAPRVLRQELREKGVDPELIEATLESIGADEQREDARRLVDAKLRSVARFDDAVQIRRLVNLLVRRGYSPSMSYEVVREAQESAKELASR
jgi:regulatory protein